MPRELAGQSVGRLRELIDLAASLAMLVAAALIIGSFFLGPRSRAQPTSVPPAPISLDGTVKKGNPSAPVGVLEFADFECPSCAIFAKSTRLQLEKEYVVPGKVLLAFRHLPLTVIHPRAMAAAVAAQCAEHQGRFWEMHDRL